MRGWCSLCRSSRSRGRETWDSLVDEPGSSGEASAPPSWSVLPWTRRSSRGYCRGFRSLLEWKISCSLLTPGGRASSVRLLLPVVWMPRCRGPAADAWLSPLPGPVCELETDRRRGDQMACEEPSDFRVSSRPGCVGGDGCQLSGEELSDSECLAVQGGPEGSSFR